MAVPILTLGAEGRDYPQLVHLLRRESIQCLVDVRPQPETSGAEGLRRGALETALPGDGIRYVYLGDALGLPATPTPGSTAEEAYQKGLRKLRRAADQGMRVALLGEPARAEECSRGRVVGVSLTMAGLVVRHLDPIGDVVPAPSTAIERGGGDRLAAARRVLREVFGFSEFRPMQERVISAVMEHRDALAVMPTGGGKSLCYQLPSLLLNGLTVVVSPLISLMRDQVDQLRQTGIPAECLNSSLAYSEYSAATQRIASGRVRLLYVAPETLQRDEIQGLLDRTTVACFAIDEAHCISQWGHDFRPEYRQLQPIRRRYPGAVCLALTATATPRVRQDIQQSLGIGDAEVFVSSFDRPNLRLSAARRSDGLKQVLTFLKERREQPGIIYCSTREAVESLADQVARGGYAVRPYHGGMDSATRDRHQREFSRDDVQIIVATIAFGMGIDKSNVRFVLHHNLPASLEGYYQEVGRAGRDGVEADCHLLWGFDDVRTLTHFAEQGAPAERQRRQLMIQTMVRYAQSRRCRRAHLLPYFGEPEPEHPCGMCDACLAEDPAALVDVTQEARLLLQCVQATGQSFGAVHLIDVLRGSTAARIQERRHHQLAEYGQGRQLSRERWRALVDEFLDQGLLLQNLDYGGLALTAAGMEVLQGRSVMAPQASATGTEERGEAEDSLLFESLRRLRKELADAANVPPYVVFSDRSLLEMASRYPCTLDQFRAISGVGEAKLKQYGETFTRRIAAYCAEHGISPPATEPPVEDAAPPRSSTRGAGARTRMLCARVTAGERLDDLSREFEVQLATLVTHLENAIRTGEKLPAQCILEQCSLSPEERTAALAALEKLGGVPLRPVFEALDGAASYEDLRILRLYREVEQRTLPSPTN